MNFSVHRRRPAGLSGAFLTGLALLAGASSVTAVPLPAVEGLTVGAAGWSQFSVVGHSSDTAGGADHNGRSTLAWGARITLDHRVSEQLHLAAGVGLAAGHSMRSMPGEPTGYAPLTVGGYVSEASFAYEFGKRAGIDRLTLRGGLFPYVYNPDVKNLGLYLLRGPVYPGFVISGFETKHVLPVANMLGLQLRHEIGSFRQDFILSSETEFYPYFDLSPAYVIGYTPHPALDLGAGVNFHHYIPVDGQLTTDKTYKYVKADSAGNPSDTVQLSFRGIKLMARASFDPKALFAAPGPFGPEDLKLYGEVALFGLDNTVAHRDMYGDYRHRMPVMAGFNLPAFGYLDHVSLEVEWYGAPFQDDLEPYLTGYNKPSPYPVGWYRTPTRNYNDDKNTTRDNWKWSLHAAKTVRSRVRISAQLANDHWRPGIYRGDGDVNLPKKQAILITPEDWYASFKLAWFL